ncbi:MAG: FmdB family zinc ribbon protein [Nitrospirota bacterium]
MPVYEYRCEECGIRFEANHSMHENPAVFCPGCRAVSKRMITGGTGFILKGSRKANAGIQCGREQTCCGRSNPCETRPCDKG